MSRLVSLLTVLAAASCAVKEAPARTVDTQPALRAESTVRAAAAWSRSDTLTIGPLAPPGLPASDFPTPTRPVSAIVSPQWTDEAIRDKQHEADTVMALLGVRTGQLVADVGAGSGYYVARLSRRVGPTGMVYGQDIMPRYMRYLRERIDRDGLTNVRLALGDPHDPRLPAQSVDLVTMIHMYHEIEQPYALLANLAPALRPGARIAILDMNRRTDQHGTPPELLRCELAAVGYTQVSFHDLETDGYLAVFAAPATVNVAKIADDARRCEALADGT
jgi:SAM-dependent methyltransferase